MTRRMLWAFQTSEGPCDVWVWLYRLPKHPPWFLAVRCECHVNGRRFVSTGAARRENLAVRDLADRASMMVDHLKDAGIAVTDGRQILPPPTGTLYQGRGVCRTVA